MKCYCFRQPCYSELQNAISFLTLVFPFILVLDESSLYQSCYSQRNTILVHSQVVTVAATNMYLLFQATLALKLNVDCFTQMFVTACTWQPTFGRYEYVKYFNHEIHLNNHNSCCKEKYLCLSNKSLSHIEKFFHWNNRPLWKWWMLIPGYVTVLCFTELSEMLPLLTAEHIWASMFWKRKTLTKVEGKCEPSLNLSVPFMSFSIQIGQTICKWQTRHILNTF